MWIKLESTDAYPGGVKIEEAICGAHMVADAGVDLIEVSGNFRKYRNKSAFFLNEAIEIANNVSVPVCVTGGIRDVAEMNHIINSTSISLIGLARPLIANSNLINQIKRRI